MENEILNDNQMKHSANIHPQIANRGSSYLYSKPHDLAVYDEMAGNMQFSESDSIDNLKEWN